MGVNYLSQLPATGLMTYCCFSSKTLLHSRLSTIMLSPGTLTCRLCEDEDSFMHANTDLVLTWRCRVEVWCWWSAAISVRRSDAGDTRAQFRRGHVTQRAIRVTDCQVDNDDVVVRPTGRRRRNWINAERAPANRSSTRCHRQLINTTCGASAAGCSKQTIRRSRWRWWAVWQLQP